MTPILFEKDTRSFTGGGICRLAEATAWSVKEVLNAEYELEMSYPAAGEHLAEIKTERIIYAKPNPTDTPQAFIIYAVSKPLRGKVQIYAEHVSHKQNKITVSPFHAKTMKEALAAVQSAVVGASPFTFTTSMNVINDINSNIPRTLRNSIYGRIISLYGGEIKYNNYAAEILTRRGSNKGFTVRYGKNLLDFNQEEDVSAVYDAVYPYYFVQDLEDEEEFTYVELPEKIIKIGTTQEKVMPLNLTTEFPEEPDVDELREAAQKYLEQNDINKGVLSVTLDFAILSETEEYKNSIPPERVELGDDVTVIIPTRGVIVHSRIVKTVYDGKKGRFSSVTVGEIETDIADTMVMIKNDLEGTQKKTASSQKSIATLNVTADDQGAKIEALTKRTTDAETLIAQIDAEVDTNRARIDLLAEFQTETEKNIAEIETEANAQGAKISLVVGTNGAGDNEIRGGIIAEAINGQTEVKISADVVNIDVIKTLNAKADEINITSDLLKISSSGFSLNKGELTATKGMIATWVIDSERIRSSFGVYGEYNYTTTGTDNKVAKGYAFASLEVDGIYYIVKETSSFDSKTLVTISMLTGRAIIEDSGGGIA